MLWLISYDIPCSRRRRAIAELLLNHGQRVQYSMFECYLTPYRQRCLDVKLQSILDNGQDSLRWYPQCTWCAKKREVYGLGKITVDNGYEIV